MTTIFISYRRSDSSGSAGRVHDRLTNEFGNELVFMDVDDIPFGSDFRTVLGDAVGQCGVLLAIIGPGWVSAKDDQGNRRLDSPNDFVRIEIETALQRRIPLVPILVDGASMPRPCELPNELTDLAFKNALEARHTSFHRDIDKLVSQLKAVVKLGPTSEGHQTLQVKADEREQEADKSFEAFSGGWPQAVSENTQNAGGCIQVEAPISHGAPNGWFQPGNGQQQWFKDHDDGPELVIIPAGTFHARGRSSHIEAPFAVARYAATFREWDAAFAAGGVSYNPDDQGWGRAQQPVVNVSWHDAQDYCSWLSNLTLESYRLLTEAEWEYCCRAGTTTDWSFGNTLTKKQAQFSGRKTGTAKKTVPVGSYQANDWGLYDMHGNVWEWCDDKYDIDGRVLKGGSWYHQRRHCRSSYRNGDEPTLRDSDVGFRVARQIDIASRP